MKKKHSTRMSRKILSLSIIPVVILFVISTITTITSLSKSLLGLVYNNIYGAGRGMELALTQLDATFTQDEVNALFDMLNEETGYHYTLYMDKQVYATSIKNGDGRLNEELDEEHYNKVMINYERLNERQHMINGEKYHVVYYPVAQQGEVFGVMFIGMKSSIYVNMIQDAPKATFYVSMVVALLAVVCGILVSRSIRKALSVTNESVETLSDGNLTPVEGTEKFAKRKDELGEVVSGVTSLQNELHKIVSDIKDNASQLLESENRIREISDTCNTASAEISRAIEEISTGSVTQANELDTASNQVSNMEMAIDEITDLIKETNNLVAKMMDSSNKTRNVFLDFIKANEQTTESIGQITTQITNSANASNKIVNAVEMINDIAAQTSLLSLNASIEAARAGEAGKGFAVVADEIRKLSEQSSASAQEIRDVVGVLTSDNEINIQMSGHLKDIIENQSVILKQSQTELEELLQVIDQTKDELDAIGVHNVKVTEAKTTLVSTISALSSIAEGNAAASEQTTASMQELSANVNLLHDSTNELHEMAENLDKHMDFFKL